VCSHRLQPRRLPRPTRLRGPEQIWEVAATRRLTLTNRLRASPLSTSGSAVRHRWAAILSPRLPDGASPPGTGWGLEDAAVILTVAATHPVERNARQSVRFGMQKLISIFRQPVPVAATRCYLIQMLWYALTCADGCSCWSPGEENSPRIFLTMDALYRLS
jgi:hypothetical protein